MSRRGSGPGGAPRTEAAILMRVSREERDALAALASELGTTVSAMLRRSPAQVESTRRIVAEYLARRIDARTALLEIGRIVR